MAAHKVKRGKIKKIRAKKAIKRRIKNSRSKNKRIKTIKNLKSRLIRAKKHKKIDRIKKEIKNPIRKELLDILACPMCKGDLRYNYNKTQLICTKCEIKYPIKDGIPVLMPPGMR